MPESPEVEAVRGFLAERAVGRAVTRVDVTAVSALKTYDPPVSALGGLTVTGVARHGKFLDLDVDGLHLVVHLARAGRLRWNDALPVHPPRPGRGPLALRLHLDDGSGFDLTEAGTQKRLAVYLVRNPGDVPGVAGLGPDPLGPDFGEARFREQLAGRRARVKTVLRDQEVVAGIGNAYSDEILHAARMSPYAIAADLTDEQLHRLYLALRGTLAAAVANARGRAAADVERGRHGGLRVHGRTGQPCPVCGDTIREVSFADSALQYCPTCQTGGRPLADRRMSRLLK
ncbi:Fpg/Nei family DNA glycosylase [Marinactinospora rubrisoli]|uniref:Fpg/Nei family DNA glycosylase n=1 Tax=Marinactinospora rubrisoli TaxID=2715399 RepID=A0ABW2KN48_9ACTN